MSLQSVRSEEEGVTPTYLLRPPQSIGVLSPRTPPDSHCPPAAIRMSVTMTKAEGVTVFTMTSDTHSVLPPLCQILKGLCYSPVCCSVSQHLKAAQRNSQSVLGALHIMVGLLNIGLGMILMCSPGGAWWIMRETMYPVWIGVLIMLFGIFGILSEKCPSPCLIVVNVMLNLAGVAFSIAAIVLYSINIATTRLWGMCTKDYSDYYSRYEQHFTTTVSPGENYMLEKCLEAKTLALILLRSMTALLIVLSALELCLVISSAVLGIKALKRGGMGEKEMGDPEHYKPLLEEVTSQPTA
ncbi:transmembrane protein 176B-like isoform X2 [Cyclopterus lumpus]|uniref:transmembrane protein 176B-like isoform X2 n=1 Tax=Cyclopterus lumpus TaxID=8103 RepID=UPI0014864BD5|nr:transmembrane protein 176B-like isoform X2 [Cyclopterus lumpus]